MTWQEWLIALHRPSFDDPFNDDAPTGADLAPHAAWWWHFANRYGSANVDRVSRATVDVHQLLRVDHAPAETDSCRLRDGRCGRSCEQKETV